MNKRILALITTAILIIGVTTVVYAKSNNMMNGTSYRKPIISQGNINSSSYRKTMMNQRNINSTTYNNMIDLMRKNGFEAGAQALESRDFNAMSNFMNTITDAQYKQMIDLMNKNGYGVMARMMGSVSRQDMVNIHNSMMGR